MSNWKNHISSRIQDIYLELPIYKHFHSPSKKGKEKDAAFIGRKKVKKRLYNVLANSETRSGAYLVTGFRGMGKTSVVREVVKDVQWKKEDLTHIEMSLAQDELKDLDVLRHLTNRIYNEYERHFRNSTLGLVWFHRYLWTSILGLIFSATIISALIIAEVPKEESGNTSDIIESYGYFKNDTVEFSWSEEKISSWRDENQDKNVNYKILGIVKNGQGISIQLWPFATILLILFSILTLFYLSRAFLKRIRDNLKNKKRGRHAFTTRIPEGKSDYQIELFNLVWVGVVAIRIVCIFIFSALIIGLFACILCALVSFSPCDNSIAFLCEFQNGLGGYILLIGLNVGALNLGMYLLTLVVRGLDRGRAVYLFDKISDIQERIKAQITREKGEGIGVGFQNMSGLFSRKMSIYPIATAKEIEYELIDFLERLGSFAKNKPFLRFYHPPEFLIVFDELDKIAPSGSESIVQRESEDIYAGAAKGGIFDSEALRKRQEALARLLANLKHFLNVAQAKFVFIAGREMFDASLADITDRQSFFGSVFHAVFYVESFHKDALESPAYGITRLTEHMVCSKLIDKKTFDKIMDKQESVDLKDYADYLRQRWKYPDNKKVLNWNGKSRIKRKVIWPHKLTIGPFKIPYWFEFESIKPIFYDLSAKDDTEDKSELELDWERLRFEKVISSLQSFIISLVHRSNGMPKKLNSLLEEYIEQYNYSEIQRNEEKKLQGNSGKSIWVFRPFRDKNKTKMFLVISFGDQYMTGLLSHLVRPYLISNSSYMRLAGDKLLVSTTYLMNHLFKFHQVSFSWRNIELMPEIIAFNKAPELRGFIDGLIQFLSSNMLREVNFGLFQFKFFKKISNELDFVSKISEAESAAFNFTLDESILIKRHYHRKLDILLKENRTDEHSPYDEHIHGVAFINSLLGDLYYYDREYDEAFVHYANTIQSLRQRPVTELNQLQFFIYLREKLKIGLTLEKTHVYDAALTHAIDLCGGLVAFFQHQLESKLGRENEGERIKRLEDEKNWYQEYRHKDVFLEMINTISDDSEGFWNAFGIDTNRERAKGMLGNLTLVILPFLNELVLIEKSTASGIKYDDFLQNHHKFNSLLLLASNKMTYSARLARSVYFQHLGSILYFKNGSILSNKTIDSSKYANPSIIDTGEFKYPVSAYGCYIIALNDIVKAIDHVGLDGYLDKLKPFFEKELEYSFPRIIAYSLVFSSEIKHQTVTKVEYEHIGTLLSRLGDCILTMINNRHRDEISFDLVGELLRIANEQVEGSQDGGFKFFEIIDCLEKADKRTVKTSDRVKDGRKKSVIKWPSIDAVVLCYFFSAIFYKKAGRVGSYSIQLLKFTYVLKDHLFVHRFRLKTDPLAAERATRESYLIELKDFIQNTGESFLMTKTLRVMHWADQNTGRPQILKFESIFDYDVFNTPPSFSRSLFPSSSSSSDQMEAVTMYSELLLQASTLPDEFPDERELSKKLADRYKFFKDRFVLELNPVHAYSTINSQNVRGLQLSFKAHLNFQYLKFTGLHSRFRLMDLIRQFASQNLDIQNGDLSQKWKAIEKGFEEEYLSGFKENIGDFLLEESKIAKEICEAFDGGLKTRVEQQKFFTECTEFKGLLEEKLRKIPVKYRCPEAFDDLSKIDEKLSKENGPEIIGEFLIMDSLFAWIQIMNILNVYGISYMYNHTYRGYVRKYLGDWSRYYQNFLVMYHAESRTKDPLNVRGRLGKNIAHYLDPKFNFEKAIFHFKKATEMHSEGTAYRSQLKQLYYLEDDFNDGLYHFHAAMERYKINAGLIENEIQELSKEVKFSRYYRFSSYINTKLETRKDIDDVNKASSEQHQKDLSSRRKDPLKSSKNRAKNTNKARH